MLFTFLKGHKTFHAVFGPDATTHLLNTAILLPTSWSQWQFQSFTVWELLQGLMRTEQQLRLQIDQWVLLYYEHVLLPFREVVEVFAAPLQGLSHTHVRLHSSSWDGSRGRGGTGAPHDGQSEAVRGPTVNAPKLFEVEHSFRGYVKLLATIPEYCKAIYDKIFAAVYLVLYYIVQGKPHPALSDQNLNHHNVLQLREELLLLILLCMIFCAILCFKLLRRRLNDAVRQQHLLNLL